MDGAAQRAVRRQHGKGHPELRRPRGDGVVGMIASSQSDHCRACAGSRAIRL